MTDPEARSANAVDDATLVAWIDGELDEASARRLREQLVGSEELRAREAMLRAARGAAQEFLRDGPLGSEGSRPASRRARELSLVAAALMILSLLYLIDRGATSEDARARAEDEWLSVRVIPIRAAWPMFSAIAFDLEGRAKTDTHCRVLARKLDESDAQIAERLRSDEGAKRTRSLVLDVEIVDPGGVRRHGVALDVAGEFTREASHVRVSLTDAVVQIDGISPLVSGRPTEDGLEPDPIWPIRHRVTPGIGGRHGFVPEATGDWRIRFVLRPLVGASATSEPSASLSVETAFRVEAEVGAYSEPVDGLSARIVAPRHECSGSAPVFALQLENRSDRSRAFNVIGITMAKIPQPFHFDLIVDGEVWTQRDDLPVTIAAESGFLPLPSGGMRSIVVTADCWRHDGKRLDELEGAHRVAFRFHFEPTLWTGDGRDLWMGSVETPPVEVVMKTSH